jgi:hypothetical protein
MTAVVVNRRREAYDVYIGRGSRWGNPFRMGQDGDRAEVIEKYRAWIEEQLRDVAGLRDEFRALKGMRLGCYCKPLACHGDVLLELLGREP